MRVTNYLDKVYAVENFLSEEECDEIVHLCESVPDGDWLNDNPTEFWRDKVFRYLPQELIDNLNSKVISMFENYSNFIRIGSIARVRDGQDGIHGHIDVYGGDVNNVVDFGIVLYPNDDYDGGELFYKDINLKIKPIGGSVVVHRGSTFHEALPVRNGTRYMITCFIYNTDPKQSVKFKYE